MNRKQRRSARHAPKPGLSRSHQTEATLAQSAPAAESDAGLTWVGLSPADSPSVQRPSLLVRTIAWVLLSRFVTSRIHHPDACRLLASLAQEAGRTQLAQELIARSRGMKA